MYLEGVKTQTIFLLNSFCFLNTQFKAKKSNSVLAPLIAILLIVCHYCCFNHEFKFQSSVYNGCHDMTMLCLNLSDIASITVKGVDYRCISHYISESDAIAFFRKFSS